VVDFEIGQRYQPLTEAPFSSTEQTTNPHARISWALHRISLGGWAALHWRGDAARHFNKQPHPQSPHSQLALTSPDRRNQSSFACKHFLLGLARVSCAQHDAVVCLESGLESDAASPAFPPAVDAVSLCIHVRPFLAASATANTAGCSRTAVLRNNTSAGGCTYRGSYL
jgi:hypothetical protein